MVKSDYDSFFLFFCQNNHEGFYAWCAVWEQKVVGQFLTQSPRSMHFALLFMYLRHIILLKTFHSVKKNKSVRPVLSYYSLQNAYNTFNYKH